LTKIAVFVPTTHYGGVDVLEASISRQSVKPDLIIVADEIKKRDNAEFWLNVFWDFPLNLLHTNLKPGNKRNLCLAYNEAARVSLEENCDLLISLQDFIWIPERGIERFVKIHESNPNDLITGITHISKDPEPDKIFNKKDYYSIFSKSFFEKPKEISWHDVRKTEIYKNFDGDFFAINPIHWEANWAAVPVSKFKQGIFWDEEFDVGIAYENQDFAVNCVKNTNCEVLLDIRNEAISLPHKQYFPGEEEEIIK